jgi:hypothetical protein
MLVSHAGSERQNAVVSGQSARIARISRSPAFMRTASETEQRSTYDYSDHFGCELIARQAVWEYD